MSSPIGAALFGLDEDSSDPDVPDLLDSHVGSSSGGGRGGKSSSGSAAARRRRRREEKVQGIAEVAQLSAMALSRRMTQVHKSRLGADLEIELSDGSRERVHRAILATVSQGFKTMLIGSGEAGKFAEADMDVVKVEAEAPAFAALVEYAYTGQIHVKSEHVMSVVQLADQFGIDMLKLMASTQAYNDLTDDNVIDLLNAAANYNATALVKRCVDYLAPRAETVLLETNAHEAITRDALVLLLGVDELCVEELDLLHFVMRWGEYQLALHPEAETVQRVLDGIIELVRFGLINSADLHSKVLPLGLVPPEVILDAVLVRTMGKTKREKLGLEKPRPRAGGQRFEFETLQDQNGIIYAIATKMGQQAWTNPHDAGIVTVSLSSSGGSHVRSCVDRNFGSTTVENSFGTSGRVDPWLQLDFRNYRVSPHMYTVHQERDAFIRSWNLEGSEDAVTWTVLSEHRDDTTIQSSNLGGAFEVTDPSPEKFRYLRLHLTGPSHNGNKDFDITQIEFYGLLSNSLVD